MDGFQLRDGSHVFIGSNSYIGSHSMDGKRFITLVRINDRGHHLLHGSHCAGSQDEKGFHIREGLHV